MKKKIVSLFLAGTVLISGSAFAYNDIDNHWAKNYIANMKNAGVLEQFDDDSIYPEWKMTREECAVLISDFAEKYYGYVPEYREHNYRFADLIDGSKSDKVRALSLLYFDTLLFNRQGLNTYRARIIEGYPDGDFKPHNPVTRAEFSKMLVTTIDCFGYTNNGNYGRVDDSDLKGHWGNDYMAILRSMGILEGYETIHMNGIEFVRFSPERDVSRAEAIKMIAKARELNKAERYHSNGLPGTRLEGEKKLYYLSE